MKEELFCSTKTSKKDIKDEETQFHLHGGSIYSSSGPPNFITMFWALCLSILVVWSKGSTSQSVVSQPPSASVSLGTTEKLACILGSGLSIGSYRIRWYQQTSPSSPRFLLHYHTDSDKGQGSGVPSRFSATNCTSLTDVWAMENLTPSPPEEADGQKMQSHVMPSEVEKGILKLCAYELGLMWITLITYLSLPPVVVSMEILWIFWLARKWDCLAIWMPF
ncbi:hypothetical protein Chor_011663 [Crotalus horridus]